MSSADLLSSWRARWHKAGWAEWQEPYDSGRASWVVDKLARSRVWRMALTAPASVIAGAGLLIFGVAAPLSLNGQILFSVLLIVFAALMRRVDNPGLRLTLAYLSALASWRYLAWRVGATLPQDGAGLLLGTLLWTAEVLAWAVLAFGDASPLWLLRGAAGSRAEHLIRRAREQLTALARILHFYRPVASAVTIIWPGLCLVLAREPLHTSVTVLLAFALPHLTLQRMALMSSTDGRIPMRRLVHEWLLEGVMLWRTAISFSWTFLRNLGSATIRTSARRLPNPALPGTVWLREACVLAIQTGGLLAWALGTWDPHHDMSDVELLLLGWSMLNIMASLTRLAQRKEHALVSLELARRAHQDVLVALGGGRVLRGQVSNFPQSTLHIQVSQTPTRLPIRMPAAGDAVGFSVFFREFEQSFRATVESSSATGLSLRVDLEDLDHYHAFGAAVFSRDSDWPAWLAPEKADRLLPAGLHRLFDALEAFIYDFFVASKGPQLLLQRLWFWRRPPTASGD